MIALRRLFHAALVVFGVLTVVFFLTRVVSDPARLQVAAEASQQDYEVVKERLGLDGPLLHQYRTYLGDLTSLRFGDSFAQNRPASAVVGEAVPKTVQLVATALPITVVISIALGTAAAMRPRGVVDRIVSSTSLIGFSVPPFLLGLALILLIGVWWGILPTSGTGSLRHLVLPVVTLVLSSTGRLTTMVRSAMIDELHQPWIDVARAKGMPTRRIVIVHALRNAAVGVITMVGLELITMVAGYVVVVEYVFAWPGLGAAALAATRRQDLPVVQLIVLVIALLVVVVNVLIDVAYSIIDPRIKFR